MSTVKDLTKEAPRSPRTRLGDYIILARSLDKGRAALKNQVGDYHFDCPLDNFLFGFKGVKGSEIKEQLEAGASDEDIVKWLDTHGTAKTSDEVTAWGKEVEGYRPYDDPEKKEWFSGECAKIGVDPAKSTLFDWLEADDKASF